MKVVIQRVKEASVKTDGKVIGAIGLGLMILVGIAPDDTEEDMMWLIHKIMQLRIFEDETKVMNLSVIDVKGEILLISQFTLYASTKKGNRPSYIKAATPALAEALYNRFYQLMLANFSGIVATGKFGADMEVSLINYGPVTILIDSKNRE